MQNHTADSDLTHKKLILELDKIKMFDIHSNAKPRIINPPTKTAKDILQSLNLSPEFVCDNFEGI